MEPYNVARTDRPQPTLVSIDQVADGWIKKYILHYRLPNGQDYTYESVSRKNLAAYTREISDGDNAPAHLTKTDAVCIVPRTMDNRLVMIREFRYPLNRWCIAFPAGLVDPGENVEECVARELSEETGYRLHVDADGKTHVRALSQPAYSSSGISEESVQVVYVHVDDEPDPAHTEAAEFIDVFTVRMDDVPGFLASSTDAIGTRAQLILESFANNINRYGDA